MARTAAALMLAVILSASATCVVLAFEGGGYYVEDPDTEYRRQQTRLMKAQADYYERKNRETRYSQPIGSNDYQERQTRALEKIADSQDNEYKTAAEIFGIN